MYKQDMILVLGLLLLQGINLKENGMPTSRELQIRNITRPETCFVLSHVKILFKKTFFRESVMGSLAPGFLNHCALTYFPMSVSEEYKNDVLSHPLYERICITSLVNRMIDLGGASFISYLDREQDRSRVVKAFIISDKLFGISDLWAGIEKKKSLDWRSRRKMLAKVRNLLYASMDYFLYCMGDLEKALQKLGVYQGNLDLLVKHHDEILHKTSHEDRLDIVTKLRNYIHVIEVADPSNLLSFAKAYSTMLRQSHMEWFMRHVHEVNGSDDWEKMLAEGLRRKLNTCLRNFALHMLKSANCAEFFPLQLKNGTMQIFSRNMGLLRESKTMNLERASVIVLDFERAVCALKS